MHRNKQQPYPNACGSSLQPENDVEEWHHLENKLNGLSWNCKYHQRMQMTMQNT